LPAPCDVFAIGVLLFVLIFPLHPWEHAFGVHDPRETLLDTDPERRPTVQQILGNGWFAGEREVWPVLAVSREPKTKCPLIPPPRSNRLFAPGSFARMTESTSAHIRRKCSVCNSARTLPRSV
jgi:hypothetical protein